MKVSSKELITTSMPRQYRSNAAIPAHSAPPSAPATMASTSRDGPAGWIFRATKAAVIAPMVTWPS